MPALSPNLLSRRKNTLSIILRNIRYERFRLYGTLGKTDFFVSRFSAGCLWLNYFAADVSSFFSHREKSSKSPMSLALSLTWISATRA